MAITEPVGRILKNCDALQRSLAFRRRHDRFRTVSIWRRNLLPILAVLIVARYLVVWTNETEPRFILPGSYKVVDVNDGFHLVLQAIDSNVRYDVKILGVDFPNDNNLSLHQKATDFTRSVCLHRTVRVHLDRRRIDRERQLLTHIYIDDELLSAKLIRKGFATNSILQSDSGSVAKKLRQAEEAIAVARQTSD